MDPQEVVGVLPRDGGGEEGAPSTCAKLSTAQQQVVNALGNRRSFCQSQSASRVCVCVPLAHKGLSEYYSCKGGDEYSE